MRTSKRNWLLGIVSAVALIMAMATVITFTAPKSSIKASAEVTPTTDTFETIGMSVRLIGKSGLRFTTCVKASYLKDLEDSGDEYQFGTLIIPTALLGGSELTVNTAKARKVPTVLWGAEKIKDGCSYVLGRKRSETNHDS